jgi:hypothetical protein
VSCRKNMKYERGLGYVPGPLCSNRAATRQECYFVTVPLLLPLTHHLTLAVA